MDALDRLQSGLFFRRLNAVEPAPSVPQRPALPETSWEFQMTSARHDAISNHAYTPSPSTTNQSLPEIPMPLLSVSVDVDIQGRLCTTKVTQQFSNTSASATQNAKYVFPIYDGWAVTSFRCWIGTDKLLEGAVKAKEEARTDFKHAVSQRRAAVLVEEVAPEVFETNVGNIPAQTTVKIEITYVHWLKIDSSTGGLGLTIPTSIAPRYGLPPAGYTSNQPLPVDGLRINVQVSMPAPIRKMESGSHPISVEMGKVSHDNFKEFAAGVSSDRVDYTKGQATLSDRSALLDKDFVLHIMSDAREALQSRAIAATQPSQPTRSTIAVTIHPGDLFQRDADLGGFDGEILFMVDRSASMESKIPALVDVMNIFLRSLPEKCSFNIASFGWECTWLWPSSQGYRQATLDLASKHIGSFHADYGGTEIYRALESVLEHYNKRSDVPTNVILLTDGEVWDVDNVIRLVRTVTSDRNSAIRFFSLGIGDQVSHRLVEGIGKQGGGYAEVVPESGMRSWQERVIQMLKAALTPSRLQCAVDLGQDDPMKTSKREIAGYQVLCPEFIQTPHHIPILNTFSDTTLYYMVEGELDSLPKTINVTATTEKGETLAAQLPVHPVSKQSAIHHLAAKALINDYETQQSWLHSLNPVLKSTNPAGFDNVVEQEAQHLGRTWCIPSQWTSYVAIDRRTTEHHVVSVYRAAAVELSQLTQPRYPTSPRLAGPLRKKSGFAYRKKGPIDFDCPSNPPSSDRDPFPATFKPKPAVEKLETADGNNQHCQRESRALYIPPSGSFSLRVTRGETQPWFLGGDQQRHKSPENDDGNIGFDTYPHSATGDRLLGLDENDQYIPRSAEENFSNRGLATCISEPTWPEEGHCADQPPSDIPNLHMILSLQEADGEFNTANQNFAILEQRYRSETVKNFFQARFDHISSVSDLRAIERLRYNILIVIHITYEHAGSQALWELQIAKARQWIKGMIVELLKGNGSSHRSSEASLEELELSVIRELQEQDSQED